MGRIILFILLFAALSGYSQQINSSKFLANSNSIVRFFEFERAIQRNEEIVALYFALGSEGWKADRKLVAQCVEEEKKLKKKVQSSKVEPRYAANKNKITGLLDIIIQCFDNLYKYGPQSSQFKRSDEIYQPKLKLHLDTLITYFGMEAYMKIDSEGMSKVREDAYNIKFPQQDKADQLLANNKVMAAYQVVLSDKENLNNDAALLYLSDLLLKKRFRDSININGADSIGLYYLKRIINKNSYSPFLFEAWRKWRAATQMEYGASKTSEIPNDLYDEKRAKLLKVILVYLNKNQSDTWAYIQFFDFNEYEIIHRFGDYPYGNQSAIERQELFYGE